MKKIYLIILTTLIAISGFAQDFHFSQYWGSPLNLNPALTGVFNDNFRFNANYRNQWFNFTTFTSYAVSVDANLFSKKLNGSFIGTGLSFYQDVEGEGEFKNTGVNLALSYNQKFGDWGTKHYIGLGLQAGHNRKQINLKDLVYGTLFSDNINSDPIDNAGYDSKGILDFSAGINYFANFSERHNLGLGFAMSHIGQPNISFGNDIGDVLYRKYSVNASGSVLLNNDKLAILPTVLFQKQGPHKEINAGVYLKLLLNEINNTAMYFGGMYRLSGYQDNSFGSDAFIAGIRMEYQTLDIGLSYDLTTSDLRNVANFMGGPELYVTYTIGTTSKNSSKLNCPKF